MKLIVGLGNPGKKYVGTRHNVGADLVRSLDRVEGARLFVTDTFMNESGPAVASALKKWKISSADLIVVHDDLDLPLGTIKISTGSSAAGHKGVQSVIDALGTKDFTRARMGIGRPPDPTTDHADFVLQKFDVHDHATVEVMKQEAIKKLSEVAH